MPRHWWQRTAQPSPDTVPTGQPAPEAVPPDLLAWAQAVDVSRLSDKTVREAEDYLRKYRHMMLQRSRYEGWRLMEIIEAQVSPAPPVGIHPLDVIATVLAVRRQQLGIG